MNSIIEVGTVLAVSANSVLIETINRSACAQCAAKSTCGQSTLSSWMETSNQLRIARPKAQLAPGDVIEISMNGDLLAKASLVVYGLPLLFLLLGTGIAFAFSATDFAAFLGAASGLAVGLSLVSVVDRFWSKRSPLTPIFHQIITAKSLN